MQVAASPSSRRGSSLPARSARGDRRGMVAPAAGAGRYVDRSRKRLCGIEPAEGSCQECGWTARRRHRRRVTARPLDHGPEPLEGDFSPTPDLEKPVRDAARRGQTERVSYQLVVPRGNARPWARSSSGPTTKPTATADVRGVLLPQQGGSAPRTASSSGSDSSLRAGRSKSLTGWALAANSDHLRTCLTKVEHELTTDDALERQGC